MADPIPNVTPYVGDLPDLDDPVTFDARMTSFGTWFDSVVTEIELTVDGMNLALDDDGSTLGTAGESLELAANSAGAPTTGGSANAYTLTAVDTIGSYSDGQAFRFRLSAANTGASTINIDSQGAIPIQKRDATNTLIAVASGDLGQYEIHEVVITSSGTVAELVTLPIQDVTGLIGLVVIESQDASSDATLDFTGFDATLYDAYVFEIGNLIPGTDAQNLELRTSTDGGSTYDSSAANYTYYKKTATNEVSPTELSTGGNATAVELAETLGNAAGEDGVSLTLKVSAPHLTKKTRMAWYGSFDNASGEDVDLRGSGVRNSSADVDAIRFLFSSGNIASGTITMYGLRNA